MQPTITNVSLGGIHIGLSNKSINQTGLSCELIGHERLAFFCGPNHPLYQQKDIPLSALKGLDYVSFESDQPGEGLSCVAQFRAEHQCWGKLVAVSSNEEEVQRLIIADVGFGALTMEGSRAYVDQQQLWQLPPYVQLLMSQVYLVTQDNQPLPIAEQLFVAMLRKKVSALWSAPQA
jgi:DNA-binding transcriptional LysR family regulator